MISHKKKIATSKGEFEIKIKKIKQKKIVLSIHNKKYGYPYYRYVDLDMTEELGHDKDGKPQYRQASKKWEINNQPTLTE